MRPSVFLIQTGLGQIYSKLLSKGSSPLHQFLQKEFLLHIYTEKMLLI
jgi:hypothetical protein